MTAQLGKRAIAMTITPKTSNHFVNTWMTNDWVWYILEIKSTNWSSTGPSLATTLAVGTGPTVTDAPGQDASGAGASDGRSREAHRRQR
jgi:hypothetical protein